MDELRQELAKDYLRQRRHCVAEVANLVGYSEASAFNRAFKRWTGKTPRQFRTSGG